MIKFICYPRCSTCLKARNYLDSLNIKYIERDIKEDRLNYEELKEIYLKSKLPLKKFFNTSGLLYKSLELKNKLPAMTEDEMLSLLSSDGMLVKRPIVIGEDLVLIGFKEAEWKDKFNK